MSLSAGNKRWLCLIDAVVLFLFLGLVYAWSNFAGPLEAEFGWVRAETSLVFSLCMSFFCLGGLASGFLLRRHSPTPVLLLCAVCVPAGFVLASRVSSLAGLYAAYGVLVGFGIGLGYNCVISTLLKWFPEKPGFISGVVLLGFGWGGLVLGTLSSSMTSAFGWRFTFLCLGAAFAFLIVFSTLFIRNPPAASGPARSPASASGDGGSEMTAAQMLRRRSFWIYFCWTTLLAAAGLALLGHSSLLAGDMGGSPALASLLTGAVSVSNGSSRLIMGFLYDKIGRRKSMYAVSLGCSAAFLLILLALETRSLALLTAGYVCGGLSFGGIVPINSAVCHSFYGRENYAMNFSVITLHMLVSSFLGPMLAGGMQTLTGSFSGVAALMSLFGAVSFVLSSLLKKA
ncbi:MAG: MFS transporter [Synergistaceae bacterium]|nr:MFS transporter [Synergistaceae bacterium]